MGKLDAVSGVGQLAETAPPRLGADASATGFTAASSWQGARPGFAFMMGELLGELEPAKKGGELRTMLDADDGLPATRLGAAHAVYALYAAVSAHAVCERARCSWRARCAVCAVCAA